MNDYTYSYSYSSQTAAPVSPVFFLVFLAFFIAVYCYMAYSIYVMAKKTNVPDAWMAWVPILNIYILIKIAGKPGWWIILFFVPLLNIIMSFVVWYNVALRLNKPAWMGLLTALIPLFVGLLASPYNTSANPPPAVMPPVSM